MGVLIVYCILILLVDTNENDICLLYIEWGKAVASALAVGDNERRAMPSLSDCRGKGTRSATPVQELADSGFPILGHNVGA